MFSACTAMFRRTSFDAVGGFADGITYEDWFLQIKMELAGMNFHHQRRLNTFKRTHGSNSHLELEKSLRDKFLIAAMFPQFKGKLVTSAIRQEQAKLIDNGTPLKAISLFARAFPLGFSPYMSLYLLRVVLGSTARKIVQGLKGD